MKSANSINIKIRIIIIKHISCIPGIDVLGIREKVFVLTVKSTRTKINDGGRKMSPKAI